MIELTLENRQALRVLHSSVMENSTITEEFAASLKTIAEDRIAEIQREADTATRISELQTLVDLIDSLTA